MTQLVTQSGRPEGMQPGSHGGTLWPNETAGQYNRGRGTQGGRGGHADHGEAGFLVFILSKMAPGRRVPIMKFAIT